MMSHSKTLLFRQGCPTVQMYQLRSGSGGAAVADLLDALNPKVLKP